MGFLWSLISRRTKLVIEAEKFSLPSETEFFNTIGRTKKYSNPHHSDYVCLLNVFSDPELGHTPTIFRGPPPVTSDEAARSFAFWAPRNDTHQGIPIPRPQCHNAMISMGSGGPGRTRTLGQGIMSRSAPRNAPLWMHQGTMIPWSRSYNYRNSMKLVGLEGLEPSTK